MAFQIVEPRIGGQNIATTDTEQHHPLGTILRAKDPTYGEGEFIYLLGVASTVVGSVVSWANNAFQTALAPIGDNIPRPVGFAMSANVANQFGWYQISGLCVVAKGTGTALTAGDAVGIDVAGEVTATSAGDEIMGAVVAADAASGATSVQLIVDRPHMQGRID